MTPWLPGRTLAVDYGDRRTGLAVCDALGITVSPLPRIEARDQAVLVEAITRLVAAEELDRIVIGLPLNMDGTEGDRAQRTRQFVNALRTALPDTPMALWDERLTSVEANDLLRDLGIHGRARKERLDSAAAAILLRAWLDKERSLHDAHRPEA